MFTFWSVSLFGTVFLYGLLVDFRMLAIWLGFFVAYHALGYFLGHSGSQSNRAKIRMATWNPPTDPNCYGKVEIDVTKVARGHQADEFIRQKAKEGVKVTYTHIALKSLGMAFTVGQQLTKIVFGRAIPVEDLDIFTLVDIEGKDLTGIPVRKCDKLPISELMGQISGKISKIKAKKDEDHKKQTGSAK